MSRKSITFKHRDGNINFYPGRSEVEIEGTTAFKKGNEEKQAFKGKIKANPEVVFEAYKLVKQAVEGQEIENGKIVFFKNGFRRIPYFTIGKPANVSEGFIKRKGVFTLFAENQRENMASRFVLTLNDLISLLGFLKQIPMRFKISDVIFERRNGKYSLINPFCKDIEYRDIERLRVVLKQFLSGKEDIIPAYIGNEASFFKKDGKFILRTDSKDFEITEDIAKDLVLFLS